MVAGKGSAPPGRGQEHPAATGGAADDRVFVRRALILIVLVAVAAALWQASHALVLLFGAVLFAIIIRGLAGLVRRAAPMPDTAAVSVVLVLLAIILGVSGWLFGSQMGAQFGQLAERLPESLSRLDQWLRSTPVGQQLLDMSGGLSGGNTGGGGEEPGGAAGRSATGGGSEGVLKEGVGWLMRTAGSILLALANSVAEVVLLLFGAMFLAFQPGLYRSGVEKLVPRDRTPQAREALDQTGRSLWLWAAGALVEMLVIGVLTTIGLWLIGVPSFLALGVIAGVLEFIPFVGPVLAAVPAVLLAFGESPTLALYTVLFYVALQQVEGNLILPLIQHKAVALPPVVAIFGILVFGSLFGVIGVLFAVPLSVALMTLVQVLYVRDTLHKPVRVEGG